MFTIIVCHYCGDVSALTKQQGEGGGLRDREKESFSPLQGMQSLLQNYSKLP